MNFTREMEGFAIGKHIDEKLAGKFPEGAIFDFDRTGYTLKIAVSDISKEEERGFQTGKFKFGCLSIDGVVFFLLKIGDDSIGFPWMDAPYNWHLVSPHDRSNPQYLAKGMGISLLVFLVESPSGIIRKIKNLTLPTDFSNAFNKLIQLQIDRGPVENYAAVLSKIYTNFQTPEEMAQRAYVASSAG